MGNYASKVISIAENEIGYLEKKSNAQLDDKTANVGSGNYTKFARDLDNIGFYNGKKNGYAWCDVFVDWCFVQAFGAETAKALLCQPDKSLGAGCTYSANYYKKAGQFYTSPKVGDQIFFRSAAKTAVVHTGIVYKVDGSKVYTIEGNTSGASGVIANGGGVCKKSYSLTYGRIYGYGRPTYDTETITTTKGDYTMEMRNLKKGCTGDDVKALQILLIGNDYGCGVSGADGDFGSATDSAVRRYQKANKLTVDGVAGEKTMKSLLGV